jgi:hypothetical protein
MERKYYLVEPNGKSMEAIKEWQRLSREAWANADALTKEYGAKPEILKGREDIHGFIFEHDPGRAWKPVSGHKGCYAPDKRIKEGKEIAKKLNAIKFPGTRAFSNLIGGGFFIIVSGGRWASISFETIGEAYVISVPVGAIPSSEEEFIPPDARLLKMSEYYAIKEAAAEKTQEKNNGKEISC